MFLRDFIHLKVKYDQNNQETIKMVSQTKHIMI